MKINNTIIMVLCFALLNLLSLGCNNDDGPSGSNNDNGPVSISGHVYFGPATSIPIRGAVVGTSLDSVTAVTDSSGSFHLVTITPPHYSSTPYTITISASGYQTGGGTWRWGDHPVDQVFYLVH